MEVLSSGLIDRLATCFRPDDVSGIQFFDHIHQWHYLLNRLTLHLPRPIIRAVHNIAGESSSIVTPKSVVSVLNWDTTNPDTNRCMVDDLILYKLISYTEFTPKASIIFTRAHEGLCNVVGLIYFGKTFSPNCSPCLLTPRSELGLR